MTQAETKKSTSKKKKDSCKHKLAAATKKDEEKVAVDVAKSAAKAKASEEKPLETPFQVNDKHKKALVKLLYCHRDKTALTYEELSREIGVGEKTKSWQCGAWKDLKDHKYIVVSSIINIKKSTSFELSEEGAKLAKSFASHEDIANMKMPETNEELHASIKARLESQTKTKKYGPLIFDVLLESKTPMDRYEIAAKLNTNPDSHGFFYSLQQLKKKMGIVCTVKGKSKSSGGRPGRQLLKLSDKAFLVSAASTKDENNAAVSEDEDIDMETTE